MLYCCSVRGSHNAGQVSFDADFRLLTTNYAQLTISELCRLQIITADGDKEENLFLTHTVTATEDNPSKRKEGMGWLSSGELLVVLFRDSARFQAKLELPRRAEQVLFQ